MLALKEDDYVTQAAAALLAKVAAAAATAVQMQTIKLLPLLL